MNLSKDEILALNENDIVAYGGKQYFVETMKSLSTGDELVFFTRFINQKDEFGIGDIEVAKHLRLPAMPGSILGAAAGTREQFAHHWDSLEAE